MFYLAQIYIYSMESMKLTSWSKRALEHGLPKQWLGQHRKVVDLGFSPACHELVLLQNHEMFTLLDLREVRARRECWVQDAPDHSGHGNRVIGFSDLFGLWVIKVKKAYNPLRA